MFAAACGFNSASSHAGALHHLKVGGLDRTYLEHVPQIHPDHPGVWLILHGGDSTAAATEQGGTWDDLSEIRWFITVYPQGIENGWADGRGQDPPDKEGVDDVAFLTAVIADVETRDAVDPSEVYLTGISNGGFMDERMACDRADLITAIAPDAASMGVATMKSCKPSRQMKVMDVQGTADPLVPYGGGVMSGRGGQSDIVSAADVFTFWFGVDRCEGVDTEPLPDRAHDGTTVTVERATGCPSPFAVELWSVVGGGHTWPGGKQYLPKAVIGPVTHQFVFEDAALVFFLGG